ncbi:MAG: hypothetical protein A2X64_03520 [Ignavibacteria bacterium GWF2_33_9]|nr:MAG: hypothetical protein A2X64_03520 [Ignavibacteria bacterium GWF2_33_9]
MNKFTLLTLAALFCLVGVAGAVTHSKNYEPIITKQGIGKQPVAVGVVPFDAQELYGKFAKNRTQAVDWIIFDSLANALSYHTANTTAYIWNPDFDVLATVKRGSHNPDDPNVSKDNSKNNLFIRISTDRGLTWDPNPVLVYDHFDEDFGGARYPSITSFSYDGELVMSYTTSMVFEDQGVWAGYITGIYGEALGGSANLYTPSCKVNGIDYTWAVADAAIVGGMSGNDLFILAADAVSSPTQDVTDNSNIGIRKTIELNEPYYMIPDAWKSNKFFDVTDAQYRSNEIIGIRVRTDGALYTGVGGNFIGEENATGVKLGFSISEDHGETWSEFKITPISLFADYASSLGLDPANALIGYQSKDFTVLENGDVYFVVYFSESSETKLFADLVHQILSVKYTATTDSWSITKITDNSGLFINLLDDNNALVASGVDFEIELAKTIDEKALVMKYVEMQGVEWVTDTTYQFQTNDIFVSTYKVGDATWSEPTNMTEDAIYNLNSHMPEVVPNNLQQIPIMQTHTILLDGEDTGNAYASAARHYIRSQWVMTGLFDAILGIDDETDNVTGLTINNIYPNPVTNDSRIDFNTSGTGNVDIIVTDLLGNQVMNVFSGMISEGTHSYNFNAGNLLNGAYFVTLRSGDASVTKQFTVIK